MKMGDIQFEATNVLNSPEVVMPARFWHLKTQDLDRSARPVDL